MRRLLGALTVAGVLLVPQPVAAWPPDVDAVREYISTRSGEVSFTVIGPHRARYAYRRYREVPAASVIKVMFMAAYLRQESVRDRELRRSDKDLLRPMIRRSDNTAATRIADMLGPRPIRRLARKARMTHFHYTRPWGLSTVTAAEQARFMYRLERYIPDRHEGFARYLLSHIVKRQRWGIGRLNKPNWRFFFKGGWGSGTGAVCHQVAWLEREDMRIGVAVMITDSPSHDYAKQTLYGVFRRLLADLPKPN
jgi:beta-lactamase class A